MVIRNNLQAVNANRQLRINTDGKAKAMEKLSSGYRINRAADDAAGLGISEKMRKEIRGLKQGASNINEGVGYCKTADGALNEAHDMLHRMKELSIKAANGTESASDRLAIDNEIQEIKTELSRIFETTKYNEEYIWGPEPPRSAKFKTVLTHYTPISYITSGNESTSDQGPGGGFELSNANSATWPLNERDSEDQWGYFNIIANRFSPDPADTTAADDPKKQQGIIFNWTALDGTEYVSDPIPWPEDTSSEKPTKDLTQQHLKDYLTRYANDPVVSRRLKGIDANIGYSVTEYTTWDDVINNLNSKRPEVRLDTYSNIELYDTSGAVTPSTLGIKASVSMYYPAVVASERDLDSTSDTSFIKPLDTSGSITNFNMIEKPVETGGIDSYGAKKYHGAFKLQFQMPINGVPTTVTGVMSPSCTYYLNTHEGDDANRDTGDYYRGHVSPTGDHWGGYTWWTDRDGGEHPYYITHTSYSSAGSADDIIENVVKNALHNSSVRGGLLDDKSVPAPDQKDSGTMVFTFNLTTDTPFAYGSRLTDADGNILKNPDGSYKLISNKTTNRVGYITMTVGTHETDTPQDIINRMLTVSGADIWSGPSGHQNNNDSGSVGSNSAYLYWDKYSPTRDIPVWSKVAVDDEYYIPEIKDLAIHTKSSAKEEVRISLRHPIINNKYLGLIDADVRTAEDALKTMDKVDNAVAIISRERSRFGAYQNRLEHAESINLNTEENTQSSESRIRDADIPHYVITLSKLNILQSAGTSMLAQANQSKQGVLDLIK